jgi:plasmid stability protein
LTPADRVSSPLKSVTDGQISFTLEREKNKESGAMTLTIDLPDEEVRALAIKARARGVSAEDYARQVLERDLDEEEHAPEPFWKAFTRRIHALPSEVFERLPADGASEHDHYLHGSPKRDS